jgi:hypothetical protein
MAYKLDLPPLLAGVHDIFHMSQLKKCLKAPVDIVMLEVTPPKVDLTYPEHPIKILDQKDHVTRCKMIKFFKVQWSNHIDEVLYHAYHISWTQLNGTGGPTMSRPTWPKGTGQEAHNRGSLEDNYRIKSC